MAQRAPWDNDPIVQPANSPGLELVVPPQPDRPSAQTPDQAAVSASQARRAPTEEALTQEQLDAARRAPDQQRFTNVSALRREFDSLPDIQRFHGTRNAAIAIRRLAETRDENGQVPAYADIGMIFTYMRALDPTSTVREGEFATAQNATGVPDRVRNQYNNLLSGNRLSDGQRHEMLLSVGALYNGAASSYNDRAERYRRMIADLGENPGNHIPLAIDTSERRDRPHGGRHEGDGIIFGDQDVPPGWVAPSPEFRGQLAQIEQFANTGRPTAEQIVARAQGLGMVMDDRFRSAIRRGVEIRDRDGAPMDFQPYVPPPPNISDARSEVGGSPGRITGEEVDATMRGVADVFTIGHADEVAAAGDTIFGSGTYDENLARQRAIDGFDQESHAGPRVGGQLAAGLLIPTRLSNVARTAATTALRNGATRAEAIAVARAAAARQMGVEGSAYGGGYGYGSSEGDAVSLEALVDSVIGAAAGGVTGRLVGEAGARISRAAPAARERVPLVDPQTGRLNEPLSDATSAERMAAAAQHGIDLPMGAAGGRTAAILEKGMDIMPGSAGVMDAARRETGSQVEGAIEGVASRYGSAESMYAGGRAAQRGAQGWITRFQRISGEAYDRIPISPDAPAALDSSRATLEQLTSRFASNPELAGILNNSRLQGYRQAFERGGLSWTDLKEFRSRIGYEIGEQLFSESPTRTDLRALYAALSTDMRASAVAQGPGALRAFERANTLYQQGQQRIEQALVTILGNDARQSPEAAARAIQTIARSGRGTSNLDQLAQIRSSLAKNGEWDEVASSLIRLGGQPANSEGRSFDPGVFVRWYSDMSEPARNLLFGDRGRRELREALDSFVGVNQRLAGTNALRNTSQSAPGITAAGTIGTIGAAISNPVLGVQLAGVMGSNYGMARLWTHAPFVRWATGYSRMLAGAARNGVEPDPEAIARQQAHFGRLIRSARITPEIAADLADFQNQLFGPSQTLQADVRTDGAPDTRQ
jgi:hypothetical protein